VPPTQSVAQLQPAPQFQPAPQLQPAPQFQSAPQLQPAPQFQPAPPTQVGANLPPSHAPKRKNPALFAVPLALLLLVGGGFGLVTYQKNQQAQQREEKLATLRGDIKKIVLQDNALVMEMLDDGALEHITYAEFFKRADKNKEARDDLIRQLRATEAGPYGEAVGHYVALLGTENDWVRSEEAVSRASLDASTKWDAYDRAVKQSSEAGGSVQASYAAYLAAPYGSDFSQKIDYDLAKARLAGASEAAQSGWKEWTGAQSELRDKKRASSVVISDWLRNEPLAYPNFAPKRDVTRLLIARKGEYAGATSGASSGADETEKPSVQIVPVDGSSSATSQPARTPAPSVPTRVHALKPLDGERFPQTRTDDLTEDYANNLSDDDLRYAINEMYARYGMTFKDKSLQGQFEATTWYRPNEAWTMPQIERAFSDRERANFDLLVAQRQARRSGGHVSSDENAGTDDSGSTDDGASTSDDSRASDDTSSSGDANRSDSDTSNSDTSTSDTGKRTVESGE
jgi:hypothetical protein